MKVCSQTGTSLMQMFPNSSLRSLMVSFRVVSTVTFTVGLSVALTKLKLSHHHHPS